MLCIWDSSCGIKIVCFKYSLKSDNQQTFILSKSSSRSRILSSFLCAIRSFLSSTAIFIFISRVSFSFNFMSCLCLRFSSLRFCLSAFWRFSSNFFSLKGNVLYDLPSTCIKWKQCQKKKTILFDGFRESTSVSTMGLHCSAVHGIHTDILWVRSL